MEMLFWVICVVAVLCVVLAKLAISRAEGPAKGLGLPGLDTAQRLPQGSSLKPGETLSQGLQRLAAECTDGSVTVVESQPPARGSFKIQWEQEPPPKGLFFLEYAGRDGAESGRWVRLRRRGKTARGIEYIEAYDGSRNKTFRVDRILSLKPESEFDPLSNNAVDALG